MSRIIVAVLAIVSGWTTPAAPAATALVVQPDQIVLVGARAQQHVLAQRLDAGLNLGTAEVEWTIEDTAVARFKDGRVIAVGDGATVLVAKTARRSARAAITVRQASRETAWEFRRHVLPVLSKAGCNQGACHGALAGKGGFRLSLRGYDPFGDYFNITQQSRGRRVEPAQPGRSLLLTKPTGAVAHKGGLKLKVDSSDYRLIADWLIQGAPPPLETDARLERVEVLPANVHLQKGQIQQLVVRAHYSDGKIEDVTRWAKYTSAQQSVAQVSDDGIVEVTGFGEGAVSVWFSSQIVVARITSAYPVEIPQDVYVDSPRANFIDQIVLEKLTQLNLRPSPRCDDATFLRRAFLDTIGNLPTEKEVVNFLGDPDPYKRQKVIDTLLARDEFVDYWAYRWSDLLVINSRRLNDAAVKSYYQWIRGHVQQNTAWDEVARQVVTARGNNQQNGPANFYLLHQTPEDMAENASQAFLGLSINCAKCHNHPLEKWTNDQYYAMANLFARVRAKGDGAKTITVAERGDLIQPLTGKPQPPTPLDGVPLELDDAADRREHLAEWLTSAENPYFARSIANRVWAAFLGTGIVEPVDDLRISNPASNERLLSALAEYLVEHGFDLKQLMRAILNSETYQRSSHPLPENRDDQRFYARYYPRRLMAEVLLDAIAQVTEVPDAFDTIRADGMSTRKTGEYPQGTRALELYDSAVDSKFLDTFGRNRRDIVCECERSNTPTMVQVLHLHNGDTLNHKLRQPESWISRVLHSDADWDSVVRQAYLRSLSRDPSDQELRDWRQQLSKTVDVPRRELLEDIYWSLMSSRGFLFKY